MPVTMVHNHSEGIPSAASSDVIMASGMKGRFAHRDLTECRDEAV